MLTDQRESRKDPLAPQASWGGLRTRRFSLLLAGRVLALTFESLVG